MSDAPLLSNAGKSASATLAAIFIKKLAVGDVTKGLLKLNAVLIPAVRGFAVPPFATRPPIVYA